MKTIIWLKSQPKKKIEYPDCLPEILGNANDIHIYNSIKQESEAMYKMESISRVEFRP